jgi:hypothetical protein
VGREGKGGWIWLGAGAQQAAPQHARVVIVSLFRGKDAGHQHDGSPCFVADRVQIRANFSKGSASALGRLRSSRPNATA